MTVIAAATAVAAAIVRNPPATHCVALTASPVRDGAALLLVHQAGGQRAHQVGQGRDRDELVDGLSPDGQGRDERPRDDRAAEQVAGIVVHRYGDARDRGPPQRARSASRARPIARPTATTARPPKTAAGGLGWLAPVRPAVTLAAVARSAPARSAPSWPGPSHGSAGGATGIPLGLGAQVPAVAVWYTPARSRGPGSRVAGLRRPRSRVPGSRQTRLSGSGRASRVTAGPVIGLSAGQRVTAGPVIGLRAGQPRHGGSGHRAQRRASRRHGGSGHRAQRRASRRHGGPCYAGPRPSGPGRDRAAVSPAQPGRRRGPQRAGTGRASKARDRDGRGRRRGATGTIRDPARRIREQRPGAERRDPVEAPRCHGRVGSARNWTRACRHTAGPDPHRAIVARSSAPKC